MRAKGISDEALDRMAIINPSLVDDQSAEIRIKLLTDLRINASAAINAYPSILGLTTESVIAKVQNLTDLGINAATVIKVQPSILGYAPESVIAKVQNLTDLGINAATVINSMPQIVSLAAESITIKVQNLSDLGINAAKVINAEPSILGYATESVIAKVKNLTDLGIDAATIIKSQPKVLSLAPDSVQVKVNYLEEVIGVLGWNYSVLTLIESNPWILGFNRRKLAVLARIATIISIGRDVGLPPDQLRTALITPLEKHIVALSELSDVDRPGIRDFVRSARRNIMNAPERKVAAKKILNSDMISSKVKQLYRNYSRLNVDSENKLDG
ncbi:MAG: hypothetical protein ABJA67_03650 [Chthonomonadales bacterium]